MKILVIDDDLEILKLIGRMLRKYGHEVELLQNSADALDVIDKTPGLDAIVSDVLMPNVDGVEIVQSITKKHPSIWVVAMTGGGRHLPIDMLINSVKAFGAQGTLNKPFGEAELLAALPH
jgi:DNA-binding NtrC family response regulator